MADEDSGAKDLLGDPWTPPRDPRGRKRHKRNKQVAESVAVLRASGSTVEEVALRTGLSEPTLRKYYFRELDEGRVLARQMVVEAMYQKALAGNAGAARFIREEFERGEGNVPLKAKPVEKPAKEEALGKKAAADRDAKTAHEGTGWGNLLTH